MIQRKILCSLLLLFFVTTLCNIFCAQNIQAQSGSREYTAEGILGFARHLVTQKEYYRARLELKRLQSYYPGFLNPGNFYVANLYLLYKGKQMDTLLEVQKQKKIPATFKVIDSIFKADAALSLEKYKKAYSLIYSVQDFGYGNSIPVYTVKRKIITNLLLNKIETARDLLKKNVDIFNRDNLSLYQDLVTNASERYAEMKSPSLAVLMGIMPGAGYAYSGRRATGVLAFIVISVFSTLTYFSFKTDNKSLGVFLGAATAFFYSGSIVGGYMETKKYNNSIRKSLRDELAEEMSLMQDRELLYLKYGVSH